MTTYIVNKNNTMHCGNCRIRLPRLVYSCPFCNSIFSNYQVILNQLFLDYENGHLTYDEIYDIINIDKREENPDD